MVFVNIFVEHFGDFPIIFDSSRVNLSAISFGNARFNLDVSLMDEISRFHSQFLILNYDRWDLLCLGAN